MRFPRCLLVCLLVLFPATLTSADGHEALMKEVAVIGDAMAEAMLANDLDAMLGYYLDDAISLPNYGPRMQGKEALKKHHAEMSAAGMKIKSFESDPTEVWAAGDHVIEIGTYTIELDMPGMPGIKDNGKYMTVYVRQNGSLKIKAETWNTDVNPMMAMMGGGEGQDPHAGHDH